MGFRLLLAEISSYHSKGGEHVRPHQRFSSPSGGDQFISQAKKDQQKTKNRFRLLLAEISSYPILLTLLLNQG